MAKRSPEELEAKIKEWKARNNPVTRRQAKEQMRRQGLLSQAQPTIDAIPDNDKRERVNLLWNEELMFSRTDPTLIELATQLGLSGEQLDEMFVAASEL